MRHLLLTAVAVSVVAAAPKAEAFSLSSISSLLSSYGVNVTLPDREINLPPRVEEVVSQALGRAESALDGIFGEGGLLEDVDFPDIDLSDLDLPSIDFPTLPDLDLPTLPNHALPDIDQIVSGAQARAAEARAAALARAEAALEKAAARVESVFDRLDIDLPGLDLGDLPGSLDGLIDNANGVLDDLLGHQATDIPSIIASAPLENLPPVAITAIESALGRAGYFSLPATASVAVPEPTSAVLGAAGLLLAGAARRRR